MRRPSRPGGKLIATLIVLALLGLLLFALARLAAHFPWSGLG